MVPCLVVGLSVAALVAGTDGNPFPRTDVLTVKDAGLWKVRVGAAFASDRSASCLSTVVWGVARVIDTADGRVLLIPTGIRLGGPMAPEDRLDAAFVTTKEVPTGALLSARSGMPLESMSVTASSCTF